MSETRHCPKRYNCTCGYTCTISEDTDHIWFARCTQGPCWFAAAGDESHCRELVAKAGWKVRS